MTGLNPEIHTIVEIATLIRLLDRLALSPREQPAGSVLIIQGEAGMGKSRLVDELVRLTRQYGLSGILGAGASLEQHTPYRAWQEIFWSFFGIEQVTDPQERGRRVVEVAAQIVPEQLERLSLLNNLLGLNLPEKG